MKTEKTKAKAQAMYLNNVAKYKIAKELGLSLRTIRVWTKKYKWEQLKKQAIEKVADKFSEKTEKILDDQVRITELANKELLRRLERQSSISEQIETIMETAKKMRENKEMTKTEFINYVNSLNPLAVQLLENRDLINIEKHGLEVIRPKTISQYNFMKKDENNLNIQVNIPEEVKKLLEQEKDA